VLLFLAEDALPHVRQRLLALAHVHGAPFDDLPIHVITAPTLRLDGPDDQARLRQTVEAVQPQLMLLDPLVRLHRGDENSSAEMSCLLGFLRGLQRDTGCSVALVHHMSKRPRAHAGQGLRGSGDLHAWVDHGAYLTRRGGSLQLQLEHRTAAAPPPLELLITETCDEARAPHLAIAESSPLAPQAARGETPLTDRVLATLGAATGPMGRAALRQALRVNNERLGAGLDALLTDGRVARTQARTYVLATQAALEPRPP
jgi:hypothetical protein